MLHFLEGFVDLLDEGSEVERSSRYKIQNSRDSVPTPQYLRLWVYRQHAMLKTSHAISTKPSDLRQNTIMSTLLDPERIQAHFSNNVNNKFEIYEWRHAHAILSVEFPNELQDLTDLLEGFELCNSWLTSGGGNKSKIAKAVDKALLTRGWAETSFDTSYRVDKEEVESPTHSIDCFKNRVGLEVEWNNKDPFYDRDLNNFRLLYDLKVMSVGIILTRATELQDIFKELGRGSSYGASTTHMSKLLPKIKGGGSGGCPLVAIGIKKGAYSTTC